MHKRAVYLISLLVLSFAVSARADLIAHWKLDDGAGTTAVDSGGKGYNGTLIGSPKWIVGTDGGALSFNGAGDYVDFGNPADWPAGKAPRTLCGWGKTDSVAAGWRWIAAYGSAGTGLATFIGMNGTSLFGGGYGDDIQRDNFWTVDEWHHIGLTYDGTTARLYANGLEVASAAKSWNTTLARAHLGRQVNDAAEFWDGAIDDVRLYDRALTAAEIKALVPPKLKARKPIPADGATGVTQPLLQWTPGEKVQWHNVYLSTSPDLTTAELVGVKLPFAMYWHLAGLTPGVTYYWRVDELEADGVTVHTGDVWHFTTAPLKAFDPVPADGARFEDVDVTLAWTPGVTAISHDVYFGTDEAAVAGGAGDAFKGNQVIKTYEAKGLTAGTTYFWRVDEVEKSGTKQTGVVWRFRTLPLIAVTDPNLLGWWTLDEGAGVKAVDWSGHGIHGTLQGNPQWTVGAVDGALALDGDGDFVDIRAPATWPAGNAARSLCGWGKTNNVAAGWRWIAAYGAPATGQATFIGLNGTSLFGGGYGDDVQFDNFWVVNEWHHICLTYDGATAKLYADAVEVASAAKSWNTVLGLAHIGRQVNTLAEFWDGAVDDVRLYNKVLTPQEIQRAMRGDPLRAWNPHPADKSIADIRSAAPLTWSAGDNAAEHDVYLGADVPTVDGADASDTSGVYRGRISATDYTPEQDLQWGQSYAWRVDEVNNDGVITRGATWTFTVADYLIVDDFESYNDEVDMGTRIYETWIDGQTNLTTATVGNWDPPFAERVIVHSGRQAMPLDYNNINTPFYAEAEREFAPVQNWTFNGMTTLTLYFQGRTDNAADRVYVAVEDSAGKLAVAVHPDAQITRATTWIEWKIPLASFTGVNPVKVKKMYIGIGDRAQPVAGGAGRLLIDDIRVTKP